MDKSSDKQADSAAASQTPPGNTESEAKLNKPRKPAERSRAKAGAKKGGPRGPRRPRAATPRGDGDSPPRGGIRPGESCRRQSAGIRGTGCRTWREAGTNGQERTSTGG